MSDTMRPWKIIFGSGPDVMVVPADAPLAKESGERSATDDGLDGADCYLLNKTDDGQLAVLCVSANKNSGNSPLGVSYQPVINQPVRVIGLSVVVDPDTRLPAMFRYTRYKGSLMVSQHDRGFGFLVLSWPAQMSQSQIAALAAPAVSKSPLAHDSYGRFARYPTR
jgi:carbonic anhydrase